MTFPKRNAFAKDRRTGQIVRVREESPGGTNWMVRTAYKTDGYWVGSADLEPAKDPHTWDRSKLVLFLTVLAVAFVSGWSTATEIGELGGSWVLIVSAGATSAFGVWCALVNLTGLVRL